MRRQPLVAGQAGQGEAAGLVEVRVGGQGRDHRDRAGGDGGGQLVEQRLVERGGHRVAAQAAIGQGHAAQVLHRRHAGAGGLQDVGARGSGLGGDRRAQVDHHRHARLARGLHRGGEGDRRQVGVELDPVHFRGDQRLDRGAGLVRIGRGHRRERVQRRAAHRRRALRPGAVDPVEQRAAGDDARRAGRGAQLRDHRQGVAGIAHGGDPGRHEGAHVVRSRVHVQVDQAGQQQGAAVVVHGAGRVPPAGGRGPRALDAAIGHHHHALFHHLAAGGVEQAAEQDGIGLGRGGGRVRTAGGKQEQQGKDGQATAHVSPGIGEGMRARSLSASGLCSDARAGRRVAGRQGGGRRRVRACRRGGRVRAQRGRRLSARRSTSCASCRCRRGRGRCGRGRLRGGSARAGSARRRGGG